MCESSVECLLVVQGTSPAFSGTLPEDRGERRAVSSERLHSHILPTPTVHATAPPYLQVLSLPEKPPEELTAAAGKKLPPAKAPAAAGKGGAAEPDLELASLPGEPVGLLTPGLALKLNPLVVLPAKVGGVGGEHPHLSQLSKVGGGSTPSTAYQRLVGGRDRGSEANHMSHSLRPSAS